MKRKWTIGLVCLLLAALALSGCSWGKKDPADEKDPSSETEQTTPSGGGDAVAADPSDGETPVLGDGEELPVQSEDNSTPELPDLDSESGEAGETGSTGETGPESGSEPAPDGGDDLTVNEDGSITLPPLPLP